ncbi:MAG: cyclohexa-1,5-dienecarbonyl-CoA hydratase [Planctomycetota bacterium]|jgi:cyclohexa-1,5-dienecarbonyl-CoA hydratase
MTKTEAVGAPVALRELEDGAVWHAQLARPKANVLDAEMVDALHAVVERLRSSPHVKALLIEGAGKHFSFGASVQEHMPDGYREMLRRFHGLFLALLEVPVPCLAVVRGQCLGGGLELAAFCHRVFASPDAHLGQPEIALGVIAPVASVMLVERVGRGAAEDLCLSGRVVDAEEARRLGLVDELAADPLQAAQAWAREHLLPRSASSLRLAVKAVRFGYAERFRRELAGVERLYAEELMPTHDAVEGLTAFLEKRPPQWSDA